MADAPSAPAPRIRPLIPGVGASDRLAHRGTAPRRQWCPWQTRRPPPAGATTPAIASRSLLFEQIPSVFEQVASAALVTSPPGRGARQLPGDARVSRSCRLNFQARGV